MAKAFLIRWGTQNDFDSIKLQLREFGFAVDTERVFIGGEDENLHIPNESYVRDMILNEVPKYSIPNGTAIEVSDKQVLSGLGYVYTSDTLTYKTPLGNIEEIVFKKNTPLKTSVTVKVLDENIDANDNNSVTITGYNRPIEMIFLNGRLCTTHEDDPHRYIIDQDNSTLKIYGCVANDLISYF
jgi:hypothetical protein